MGVGVRTDILGTPVPHIRQQRSHVPNIGIKKGVGWKETHAPMWSSQISPGVNLPSPQSAPPLTSKDLMLLSASHPCSLKPHCVSRPLPLLPEAASLHDVSG